MIQLKAIRTNINISEEVLSKLLSSSDLEKPMPDNIRRWLDELLVLRQRTSTTANYSEIIQKMNVDGLNNLYSLSNFLQSIHLDNQQILNLLLKTHFEKKDIPKAEQEDFIKKLRNYSTNNLLEFKSIEEIISNKDGLKNE